MTEGYSIKLFGTQVNIVDDPLNNVDAGTWERIRFDPWGQEDLCYEDMVVSSD